jgi:hypothetical protein
MIEDFLSIGDVFRKGSLVFVDYGLKIWDGLGWLEKYFGFRLYFQRR